MAEALYNFIVENDDLVVKFSCANHTRRINEVVRNLLDKDNSKRESDPKVTCRFKAKTENVNFSFDGLKSEKDNVRHQAVFFENTDYPLLVKGKRPNQIKEIRLHIADHKISETDDKGRILSDGGELYGTLNFRNQVGETDFRFFYKKVESNKEYELAFETEVLSYKLDYRTDLQSIIRDVEQEYAMLRQTGYSGSFSQYASNKTHTQFPSYPEYMQGRAMGNPYYVTYNNGKPTPVAYQRAFYTNNQSNNTSNSVSRDAPEVYDVTDGQGYSCGRDIHALGSGDYGADSLGATWNRIVDWARSDKGQKALLTTLSVLEIAGGVAITIATGGTASILLTAAAGALTGGGFMSLISGYGAETQGGNFTTGWIGGEISGTLTGAGIGAGGGIFKSLALQSGATATQAASGLILMQGVSGIGGFAGGYYSSEYMQNQSSGEIDKDLAIRSGEVSGFIAATSWPFEAVSSALGAAGIGGTVFSIVEELIFDYSSYYAGQSLEVAP